MTRALLVISAITTALCAQDDLYAPTRPAMRRGPDPIRFNLTEPETLRTGEAGYPLPALLSQPVLTLSQMRRGPDLAIATPLNLLDLDNPVRPPMRRDPILIAAKAPPQPIAPGNRGWRPATQLELAQSQPHASLAQPPPGPVLALNPDVAVTVSPMSRAASERILGKRIGKVAMVWLVTLENRTLDPVLISPSAIYRHISHLQPFDHIVMSQLIEEGVRNSFLARSGRAAGDVGKLSAFLIASKTIQIAETWPLALVTGAGWAIPYLIDRLKGAETPVSVNFARLAWVDPITLGPGETATAHIFSELWDSPSPINFSLDVSRVTLRKSLQ